MALEPRLKAGIILLGGLLVMSIHDTPMPPEMDGFNYAPRVTAPVLMLNGRSDALFPTRPRKCRCIVCSARRRT